MAKPVTDRFGQVVRVGDSVRGSGVNEHLVGVVIEIRRTPGLKPIVIRTTSGALAYMNKSWTEVCPRGEEHQ